MSDEIDATNDRVLLEAELAIKNIRAAKPEAEATGECLHCNELVPEGRRWCDADCRDAWDKDQRARRMR